jgi:class 3 adenylate cyclase
MALLDDLKNKVTEVLLSKTSIRSGRVVPAAEDVQLGEDIVFFDRATILYADINGSTKLVDEYPWWFAREIYKSYLYCAARIIRNEGGEISAYDGDRIMGVFVDGYQSSNAARAALRINYATHSIINPAIKKNYANYTQDARLCQYQLKQVVGIDTSPIRVAKTGVRGDNDLVWIGRAANYAAKLTELNLEPPTWITKDVFDHLKDEVKFGGSEKKLMWKKWVWNQMNKVEIYSSTWSWSI